MKRHWKISLLLLVFTLLLGVFSLALNPKTATAANPTTMSFQGKVVNANGTNVTNGTYTFVFKLYTASSGGTALWTETDSLTVTNGIFQVSLGASCPLFTANACNNNTPIDFNANPSIFMGMTFNSDPAGEMLPRVQMQSAPYAFNSDKVGGLSVSQLVQLSPGVQQSGFVNVSGTINGATLSGGTVSGGTLTVSSVNSLNVSGTAITGTSALAIAAGSTAQNISLDGSTTGQVLLGGSSTGDILLGGGSGSTGCTLTNSTGALACSSTLTVGANTSLSSATLTIGGVAVCTSAGCLAGGGLSKNAIDTSSFAVTAANNLYTFTNSSSAVASGVLKLNNGTNTNSTFTATTSGNPTAGQAVIFGSNTNASPTGNLLDLQSGSSPTSKFSVTAAGVLTAASTINGATITSTTFNTATISGGTVSGGTLTGTAVNSLNVSGTAITGTGALAVTAGGTNTALSLDGNGTGAVNIGNTSTGDILLGGGSGSTGCTVTNSTGAFACTSTINGAAITSTTFNTATISGGTLSAGTVTGGTLSASAVNSLNVSGTSISGSGSGLAISAGGTAQVLNLDAATSGAINIGNTSTGDILLGGGSSSTGCTVTNSSGNLACTGTLTAGTGITVTSGNTLTSNLGVQFTSSDTNPTCSAGDYKIYADTSETSIKKCVDGVISNVESDKIRSFVDTTADPVIDANTTSYWDTAAENNNVFPNITPSGTDKEVFGIATLETQSTGTADVEVTARVEYSTTSGLACNTGTAVGGQFGTFSSNTSARKTSTTTFVYSPGSTTKQYFNICSDVDTVGTTANVTRLRISLFEVDNSNADLAEVYPTNDRSLSAGDLVSLDSSLENGVKKTGQAYDTQMIGVVSTSPALVIGGKGSQGVNGVPVALSGRVPVKVSIENGPIQPGDPLTASSTPGVAMRASKAGTIIGVAMQDFNSTEQGTVMTFVKSGNNLSSSLSRTLNQAGISQDSGDIASQALKYFTSINNNPGAPQNLSEILTDRLGAALEIVTPKVRSNEVRTDKISAESGDNVQISLGENGEVNIIGADQSVVASIDSKGNAHFNGSVSADKISASEIEGLQGLEDRVKTLETGSSSKSPTDTTKPTTPTKEYSVVASKDKIEIVNSDNATKLTIDSVGNASLAGSLSLNSAALSGGLNVGGDANFAGLTTFQKLATFIAKTVFKQDVSFEGHVAVSGDGGGYALIKQGESSVHISFTNPYDVIPVVSATVSNGQSAQFSTDKITANGFDIKLDNPATNDIKFSWLAAGVNNPITAANTPTGKLPQ